MDTSHRRDQFRYTVDQLEALLPSCWDEDYGILAAKAEERIRSGGDPAHGGGLAAMVADVRRAYWSLDKEQHELLHARYHHLLSLSAITELGGFESEQETADLLDLAVRDMIRFLGSEL